MYIVSKIRFKKPSYLEIMMVNNNFFVVHFSYAQNILEIGPGGLEDETVEHGRGVGEGEEGRVENAGCQHIAMEWHLFRK